MIPQLEASHLTYNRLPRSVFTYFSAPLFSDSTHPPACRPEDARAICDNVDRAQMLQCRPANTSRPDPAVHVLPAPFRWCWRSYTGCPRTRPAPPQAVPHSCLRV